jgi:hypothetical protein
LLVSLSPTAAAIALKLAHTASKLLLAVARAFVHIEPLGCCCVVMMGPLIGAGRQIADPVIYITAAHMRDDDYDDACDCGLLLI